MSADQSDNPLNMYQLDQDGPFVLPKTNCSVRRADFLRRGNEFLGFYTVTSITSKQGFEAIFQTGQQRLFSDGTFLRFTMADGETISQLNYGLFKKLFSRAPSHLTNQVFLMLYGSFEAYIADLVLDGLTHQDTKDPYQEALHLMVLAKWRGKIDRIGQKLNVGLGKRRFVAKFRDIELEFLGEKFKDPLEFLERAGGLRHLLVHSSGRVDEAFASQYPNANLRAGDTISLPTDLPIALHLFLVHLSDLFDEIFAAKFGWDRTTIGPETLAGY